MISDRGLLLDLGHLTTRGRCGRQSRHQDLAVATARLRRLEGAPGVEIAVGQAGNLAAAAEMEVRVLGSPMGQRQLASVSV